ncbi:MAG: histidinol dehydrogenase [Enterobacterales bacterium]|nr:histidinol dehydrogenase [Enterobacterales bacterium]
MMAKSNIVNAEQWSRPALASDPQLTNKVAEMLQAIQQNSAKAVEQLSLQFDQRLPKMIELESFDSYALDRQLAESIKTAAQRIERFAQFQKQSVKTTSYRDEYGSFGQQVLPIERVGAYIPAGRFPLISTALMTLIPAKVAGCPVRIACSPSDDPAILAAASLAGATQFIQIGGVQAIGALAFGYQQIKAVDLIVGPGNAWVNEAKKQIQTQTKIDGLAGPSELLAICDDQQPIEWLALDALAQAEHDPIACSLLVSDSLPWLQKMQGYLESKTEMKVLLENKQVELILAKDHQALIDFSNDYAPEHLMLCHKGIKADSLVNYGSLFFGANSAVALGDYITGPNHTLPTLGFARQNGGLNVMSFLRILTTQSITDQGRKSICQQAMPLAKAEGLEFHYQSLKIRSE